MIIHNQNKAVELLLSQKVLPFFQGKRSEIGPRALGNRSLLFDPRNKLAKDIINKVKKRENYRPFAGSVLEEYAHEWFEMRNIKQSPYMLFAIPVRKEKKDIISSITHVDGTCRLQTVSEKQNKKFYGLIKAFYEKTKVPILLNTSFNLAGDPLVQTVGQALGMMKKTNIEYLYIPH
jgi:carbamoyltransferase